MTSAINHTETINVNTHKNYQIDLLHAATEIGMRVCSEAIWHQNQCAWISMQHDYRAGEKPELMSATTGPGLYNGSAGIAYFLKYLYQYTDLSIFKKHMLGAMNHAIHHSKQLPDMMRHSYWSGHLGIALTALEIGQLLDDMALEEYAVNTLHNIFKRNDLEKAGLDILDGCAGAIIATLRYREIIPESIYSLLNQYLRALAERLMESSQESHLGRSWASAHDHVPLLGYAHGQAGYAHALTEVGYHLNDDRYISAGKEAIKYENHFYDDEKNNWPDFRNQPGSSDGPKFMNAWCHGAMGIGLSRLRCYELEHESNYLEDALKCLNHSCLSHPIVFISSCQCHGFSGNAELLIYAYEVLGDISYQKEMEKMTREVLKYHASGRSWVNGLNTQHQIPGLMDGIAGIGYFYLRLYKMEQTPSLLIQKVS
jgi:lantibiotic modifying enzyme